MSDHILVPFIKVVQPVGTFFVASMSYKDVLDIAQADVRKLSETSAVDEYIGIQRKVSPLRKKEIATYCNTVDATFPTGVILSIQTVDKDGLDNGNVSFEKNNIMKIKRQVNVASILDGQHRLEGLRLAKEQLGDRPFDLNVTIFLNADIDAQAQIFSVINKAQTKVNKSLVYDLYEYSNCRCPQKTVHDVVVVLNKNEKSPFYGKVKILGVADDSSKETIAQATLAELVMDLISKDPVVDRDILKRSGLKKWLTSNKLQNYDNIKDKEKFVFRAFFVNGEDYKIVQHISTFFSEVQRKWPHSWDENRPNNILNKSTGIIALMNFLRILFLRSIETSESFEVFCKHVFNRMELSDDSFTSNKYVPGQRGQSELLKDLKKVFD